MRLNPGHLLIIQIPAAALLAAVYWRPGRRVLGVAAVCILVVSPLVTAGDTVRGTTQSVIGLHVDGPSNASEIIAAFVSAEERREDLAAERQQILEHHQIRDVPADLPDNLHAEPTDVAVVWALGARRNPPPFSSRTAHTRPRWTA